MRQARDWTVKTERVNNKEGGFFTYKEYLLDEYHKNHDNTKIINFYKQEYIDSFMMNTIKNCRLKDANNIKGGRRVESFAQGFNFVLPEQFQPTPQQWLEIYKDVKSALKEKIGCSEKCFFGNLHQENKGNSHINILVSRCDEGGKLNELLDKRSVIITGKIAFKEAVKKHVGIEPKDYTLKTDEPPHKKNLDKPTYNYKKKVKKKAKKVPESSVVLSRIKSIENTTEEQYIDKRPKLG